MNRQFSFVPCKFEKTVLYVNAASDRAISEVLYGFVDWRSRSSEGSEGDPTWCVAPQKETFSGC